VALQDIKDKLLTVDAARDRLASTEPFGSRQFGAGALKFHVGPGWGKVEKETSEEALTDTYVRFGAEEQRYQLTKLGVLEALALCGVPRDFALRCPPHLIKDQLDWWFGSGKGFGDREFKALVQGEPSADGNPGMIPAFTRATITPFSNLHLFDSALDGIKAKFGSDTEVLVDYQMAHSLGLTHCRLVIPDATRVIEGTGLDEDRWSIGVQFKNSLLAKRPTTFDGYVFRWVCTNGQTDNLVSTGAYNRRQGQDQASVDEWAKEAVDEVLGGLEHTLDGVQASTEIPVEGDVVLVLRDLFTQHGVPVREQQRVIQNMAETAGGPDGHLSMYDVMNAFTLAANADGLLPAAVSKLMEVGGHVAHAAETRCPECRRLKPTA
jgi:hypothetical protein